MPLITVIILFIFTALLFVLSGVLKNRMKLKRAVAYGEETFSIELPQGAQIKKGKGLPSISTCSDAEAFFILMTPYIGSLSLKKRESLHKTIVALKSDLKMRKEIYSYFTAEYALYDGLSDEEAAQKWSGSLS